VDKPQAMRIAEDVLTGMHFAIEKADVDSGLVRTRPLSGAQFFEFWRSDNVGPSNFAEANLHSIRRNAEVRVQQQGDKVFICCDVQIQRLSVPEHEAAGSPGAPMKRLSLSPQQEESMTWIDLGKDTRLSTAILKRIEKEIQNSKS
jgi:hypothetical protein